MREFSVPRKDGSIEVITAYDIYDFPYHNLKLPKLYKKRLTSTYFLGDFATFDIETTSQIEKDAKGNNMSYLAFMYIWQICIFGICVYGRTWEEFTEFLNRVIEILHLGSDRILVMYVHNLGYEFMFAHQFIDSIAPCKKIFAPQPRKPLTISYVGLELRCSWKLSNMSLDAFAKNEKDCPYMKLSGTMDYRKFRTPFTPLTDTEFAYSIVDVLSQYSAIKAKMLDENDNITTIPLTSTGYVRRDCRKACKAYKGYREKYFKPLRMDATIYQMLKRAGRGGDTHANRYLSNMELINVDSFDFQSDYPGQLMYKKFPMSKFEYYGRVESEEELDKLLSQYACLFTVIFTKLDCYYDTTMPYISYSKCDIVSDKFVCDNGRILEADYVKMTVTDIDYKLIIDSYDYEDCYIDDMYISEYGDLPQPIKDTVMDYYTAKTQLKVQLSYAKKKYGGEHQEVKDLQYLYDKSKNKLNGIFGMMYTDPVKGQLIYDNGEWKELPLNIEGAIEEYYNKQSSFLTYAWGVWTTAHARDDLHRMVKAFGAGCAYNDTDSAKGIDCDYKAMAELYEEFKQRAIDAGAYVEVDRKAYYMGVPEKENDVPIKRFKTMGAKKYIYEDVDGLHLTVSGVRKDGVKELGKFENFRSGFTFYDNAGLTFYYKYAPIHEITINGDTFTTASFIASEDSAYTLKLGDDYSEILDVLQFS